MEGGGRAGLRVYAGLAVATLSITNKHHGRSC